MSVMCRSGRKSTPQQQENVYLREGGASEHGDQVSSVPLKELKDVEGTGLNAL